MFESDDFDQVLSQFDFPEVSTKIQPSDEKENVHDQIDVPIIFSKQSTISPTPQNTRKYSENRTDDAICNLSSRNCKKIENLASPKHSKRKIINSYFDHQSKRKFPGPAGLLTGTLEETKDDNFCHMELLSQDIEHSQNHLRRDLFESPLWIRLLHDIKSWNLCDISLIKTIKQQALSGNLCRRKAQMVTAFVETVDRSATDPLIKLRDSTGNIECTLHRDAWSAFSPYIASEYCALVLWKPTVLTTGSAFKKHYLNITLSNIYAMYSSAVINDEDKPLPDGYTKIAEDDFTVIKMEIAPENIESNLASNSEANNDTNDLLNGLDISIFADDIF